ncbi:MAG: histidine phosphatase family protein [Sphingomonas sp. 28-62-20]|uniref:histidine phosphatase family protein n=1 Tax=Sphingomonas sp. 28-62-20 TaxID=1970433 RepID=UPI000BC8386A|nr:MAG: histidine phosphatase family protein [Sphingomonas sp. 28-62-20]
MDCKRTRRGRDFIARHGETVFNAARRIQGDVHHTPLTRAGFAQADEMGAALAACLGRMPRLTLWASPTGRALQTLAVVVEHVGLDWHQAHTDPRLAELGTGSWGERYYADLAAEVGELVHPGTGLLKSAPDGETYPAMAARLSGWLADTDDDPGDRLVIMHGLSSRVLRGLMTGADAMPAIGAPAAPSVPQGSLVMIEAGVETLVHRGTGFAPA